MSPVNAAIARRRVCVSPRKWRLSRSGNATTIASGTAMAHQTNAPRQRRLATKPSAAAATGDSERSRERQRAQTVDRPREIRVGWREREQCGAREQRHGRGPRHAHRPLRPLAPLGAPCL
jgi:hypothetical protein